MRLLVAGLGNPSAKYEKTRHNIGFIIIDSLANSLNLAWKEDKKFNALSANLIQIPPKSVFEKIYFIKPQTFMNASGEAIAPFMRYFDIDSLLVIHDELDIPLGHIYFKHGGSSGGHNGLKSIDENFSNHYARLRFGIGKQEPITHYVLSPFSALESTQLETLIPHATKAIMAFCESGNIEQVRNDFTLRIKARKNPIKCLESKADSAQNAPIKPIQPTSIKLSQDKESKNTNAQNIQTKHAKNSQILMQNLNAPKPINALDSSSFTPKGAL